MLLQNLMVTPPRAGRHVRTWKLIPVWTLSGTTYTPI